ncbi:S41 family peptidase [Paraflavitalea speifideaquila]|uniref:S41 family peptidase n=1 Tax=Paraflavitalea speifideaquila TaxID=3076558 RepID=UPI0028F154C0|nr:S41 family peptidase [Paraflavitalea speifideiaquila]
MKVMQIIATAISCLLLNTTLCLGQPGNRPITAKGQDSIIERAFRLLKDNYVFPGKLPDIEIRLRQKLNSNAYKTVTTLFDFLEMFNKDLETIAGDKHLDIFYGPVIVRQLMADKNTTNKEEPDEKYLRFLQYENFGLREVKRLDGNIGYFKFNHFADISLAKESVTAAMNFLSNSYALIIDLRENGGGHADMANYLLSYFLEDSIKIGEFRQRKTTR